MYATNGWVFNNLTYLPSPREQWASNPLGKTGSWTDGNGRQWKTECDTATTGRNACRNYAITTVVNVVNGKFVKSNQWVLNSVVMFSHSLLAHQKTIPAAAPAVTGYPVEKPFVPPTATSFRTDSRCMTGRVLCISKNQRKMAWMIDGQIYKVFDVRFGSVATPTRNGSFSVYWKSRNHTSSLYQSWMPFAMFFSGGQAVHYSPGFARRGYAGASHGCVNVRDYNGIVWLFDKQVRVGDKVVVYN